MKTYTITELNELVKNIRGFQSIETVGGNLAIVHMVDHCGYELEKVMKRTWAAKGKMYDFSIAYHFSIAL